MKLSLARILAVIVLLGITISAIADPTARVVWICTVNEGKTLDDVRATNTAWVKFMRDNVDKGISSSILTPVVGNLEGGRVVFADDYPSFDVWSQSRAVMESKEGQAMNAAFDEVVNCSNNSLYSAEKS